MVIHRVVVFVFARGAGDLGPAFVHNPGQDDVTAQAYARTARRTGAEIGRVIVWGFAHGGRYRASVKQQTERMRD